MSATPMDEVQYHVSRWAEETFNHDMLSIAAHGLAEAIAVYKAAGGRSTDIKDIVHHEWAKPRERLDVLEKSADVAILMLCLAGYMGYSLRAQVEAKLDINRLRVWPDRNAERGTLGFREHIKETNNG